MRALRTLLGLFLLSAVVAAPIVAAAQPLQNRSQVSSEVTSTTDGNLVVFSGTGGKRVKDGGAPGALVCTLCVTATSTFGTDNVLVRSDGTSRGTQSTGIVVDDSNLMGIGVTPTHTLTIPTAGGLALYNAVGTERLVMDTSSNVFQLLSEANGGSVRALRIGTASNQLLFSATTGTFTLTGSASSLTTVQAANSLVGLRFRGQITTGTVAAVTLDNANSFTASSGTQTLARVTGTFNQTSTAAGDALTIDPTFTACGSGGCNLLRAMSGATDMFRITSAGAVDVDSTITAAATTGNQTINKPCGTANIAAAGTAVTITNSLVTANTLGSAMARTNDATCSVKNYVPGAGTVTINMTAGCTAETSVQFCIIDKN